MSLKVKFSDRVLSNEDRKKARESVKSHGGTGVFKCQLTQHPWLSFTFPDYPRRVAAAKAAEMLAAEGLTYRFEQVR
jgi:hypothetical protein